jgi:cysteine desulfurase/selenocysteine lyase
MSTNINEDSLPNLLELEKLANQFFKAVPGGPNPIVQTGPLKEYNPVSDQLGGVPGADGFPIALLGNNPQPASLSGFGTSPSAINQGNVINLKEPQTSFDDPALQSSNPSNDDKIPSLPFSENGSSLHGFNQLPYQQEQSFEKELRDVLNKINAAPSIPQIPFKPDHHVPEPSYYFLKTIPMQFSAAKSTGASGIIAPPFDVNIIRQDFPILKENVNGKQLIWLDNAATTQKPKQVINRISYFYEHENSNIHRAAHELAARATDAYEGARKKVQNFLNAASANEIIFVRGATEAINLVAKSWGEQNLQAGDEIIVSHLEHHANIVPWQQLANKKNLKIKVIPVDDDGQVIIEEYLKLLGPKTKLVSFTQVSNALGTITPAEQIVRLGHLAGAKVLVDGAQSVSHMPVNVQVLDADWFVFSGHKIFAPTGIGVLYGKEALLNETQPWQGGGNMIVDVTFEHTQYHNAPGRFEAGTGNIADAVGLGAAIDYVSRIGMQNISLYEHYLLVYATQLLKEVPGLRLIGTAADKASVLSFVLEGYKTEEVGHELNKQGIAVRSGHHCAQPILRRFGVESTVRPSLAFYNTCAEIDLLAETLHRLKR